MTRRVTGTCAVTGAGDTVGRHPGVPVTPEQVADAAIEAAKAGAAVAHVHVRDPETGKGSRDPALFREAVERIRDSGTDVVINLTAGMGGDWVPSDDDPSLPGPGTDMIGPAERLERELAVARLLHPGRFVFGTEVHHRERRLRRLETIELDVQRLTGRVHPVQILQQANLEVVPQLDEAPDDA